MTTALRRPFNFGAGPAALPTELLLEIQRELLDWQGLGLSVMEIGHRTEAFMQLLHDAEQLLRRLLHIPDNYHVLFLGGAARLQFGMIAENFINEPQQAGYLVSGLWSSMAFKEVGRIKQAYCIASGESTGFTAVPPVDSWVYKENTAYCYFAPNETVNGVRCTTLPAGKNIPVVADMTSCLLSEPINVSDYALFFAGAQKNIANAGLTMVIVSDSFIQSICNDSLLTMLDYRTFVTHHSLYATPPTFNCYVAYKMFQWIERQGGVEKLYALNQKKAAKLYDFIDRSDAYQCAVAKSSRSLMNICFNLPKPELEAAFVEEAAHNGLLALRGHKTVGGLRASLYNAMPMAGVDALLCFMETFARRHCL